MNQATESPDLAQPEEVLRLESLQRALHKSEHTQLDPQSIYPVIVPFNLGEMTPFYQFPCKDLYVMWVTTSPSTVSGYVDEVYITQKQAAELQAQGASLPKLALRNIFDRTGANLSSHARQDQTGKLTSIGLMHQDGYGPARILFHPYFKQYFPNGYWLAIPARNTAMVFSKEMTASELAQAEQMVKRCYEQNEGVCLRFLEPEELAVPEDWLEDVDQWLIELSAA